MPSAQQYQRTGSFAQTTQIWGSEDDSTRIVKLYQNMNQIALILNTKSAGAFYLQEFVIGDLFFPNPNDTSNSSKPAPVERQVSRIVVNFGPLPNAGTKQVAHNLNPSATWTFTRIYGCATNPGTEYIPIPYASATTTNIVELYADTTYVYITTNGNMTAYTVCYVILEWITL
jgi:hypothetical protein